MTKNKYAHYSAPQSKTPDFARSALHILKQEPIDPALVEPTCKIIAMSGDSGDWNDLDTARHLGANATLKKPFGLQELQDAVSALLSLTPRLPYRPY